MPPRNYVSFDDLTHTATMFLKNNLNYIANDDFDTLYSHIATPALAQAVTRMLLKAGIDVKKYLTTIPDSIKHILDPYEVWVDTTSTLYTKSEIEAALDGWRNILLTQMGLSEDMIKGV